MKLKLIIQNKLDPFILSILTFTFLVIVLGSCRDEKGEIVLVAPPELLPILINASQVSTGASHTCIVSINSTIKCWGSGDSGQLGNGSENNKYTATPVPSIENATLVSAGGNIRYSDDGSVEYKASHTCTLLSDNTVKCWGSGDSGQLGNGSISNQTTPVTVSGIDNAIEVSAGECNTCALLNDKTIKCWGTSSDISSISNAKQISIGTHSCAVLSDGSVKCWGSGEYGQLGNDSNVSSNIPTNVLENPSILEKLHTVNDGVI